MLALALACLGHGGAAFAQYDDSRENDEQAADEVTALDAPEASGRAIDHGGAYDAPEMADIIVTAPYVRERSDPLSGGSILSDEELTRALKPTIGETLTQQPGVSATGFGPNASRPILRGLQGDRVRILTDGIGSFDASSSSVDHAVAINPLTADRIEILRGPAALLFGSSAIGGVVNVIDSRIPRKIPDEPIHIDAIATYGTAANERSVSGAVDLPVGSNIVLHVDGSSSKSDDLETGGYILAKPLRQAAAASADPGIAALADLKGRLPNSAAESSEVAGSGAVITDGGNLGFSVSHLENLYGVPVRYSLDPAIEAEAVRIDMRQTRADLRGEIAIAGGPFERLKLRAGAADYRHDEVEEDGSIGTSFFNQGMEARVELVQAERSGWQGASGVQYLSRDFDIDGDEKYLPQNETVQFGLFTLQGIDLSPVKLEAGLRYEHSRVSAFADADIGNPDIKRSFDALSASLGGSYEFTPGISIGLNLTHSERAPSAEELYANGPHAGTQAYEIGDADLPLEKNNGIEAIVKASGAAYELTLSAYYNRFSNFIYQQATGAILDDLPVYTNRQGKAHFYGLEANGSLKLGQFGDTAILIDGVADYTRATIDDFGPAPRIPPLRVLTGLEAQSNSIQGRIEAEFVSDQRRVATLETPTDGYVLMNASVNWQPYEHGEPLSLTLSANNIFDVTARRHASFLKDYAPLPGRDIRLTARLRF